jgi:hypothetical protein
LRVGFQDDGGELLRRSEPPQRLHVDLIGSIRGDRGLVEDARRDLNILRAQRCEDFAGVQAMSRDLIGIEPDTHRVFACPQKLDIADARQSRKHILYMQRRVVRQILRPKFDARIPVQKRAKSLSAVHSIVCSFGNNPKR